MKNKDKHTIASGISVITAVLLLKNMYEIQDVFPFLENSIIFLVFILILELIIYSVIWNWLPSKKTKKTVKKNTSNKAKNVKTTINKPSNNRLLPDHEIIKLDLKDISAKELERLCCLYYNSKGYKAAETKNGADGGIDLTYYHPENGKTAVQIKHYIHSGRKINVDEIRKLDSAKKNYGCIFTEFITTSTYTTSAKAEAPISMDTHDIYWFEREIIPWMKKEALKQKRTS